VRARDNHSPLDYYGARSTHTPLPETGIDNAAAS